MVIKIGGIEIDKSSDVSEINQLRDGLDAQGVEGFIEGVNWLNDLSVAEKIDFAQIVSSSAWEKAVWVFSFGLF